jgi:multiple antibiotic resistance protein
MKSIAIRAAVRVRPIRRSRPHSSQATIVETTKTPRPPPSLLQAWPLLIIFKAKSLKDFLAITAWNDSFFLIAFSAIFTIVNPLGAVGPFLAMTAGDPTDKRISTAKRACWVAMLVLCGCAAVGTFVFRFMGITLPALKIAGGILLILVALDMVNARESRSKGTEEEKQEGSMKHDIAVFPLGIPLLSGPGSIVSVFILMDRAHTMVHYTMIFGSIALTLLISYILLTQAGRVAIVLGQTGINVFSRLMGIALAAIAVQFVIDGIGDALPGLKH